MLDSGKFKFDDAKDEHANTTLHLAFKYCTLKEIAELNKYYKGLKTLFQMKNDHDFTPLAILKERCKHSPESLAIVKQLQEEIEGSESPHVSGDEEKSGSKRTKKKSDEDKHSDEGEKGSKKKHSHRKDHHEEEENKKHSDDEDKGSKKHKHHKKHDDEEHDKKDKHKKGSDEEKSE